MTAPAQRETDLPGSIDGLRERLIAMRGAVLTRRVQHGFAGWPDFICGAALVGFGLALLRIAGLFWDPRNG